MRKPLFRSPLLHFLLLGALLFTLKSLFWDGPSTVIVEVAQSEIAERLAAYQRQMGRPASQIEALAIENQIIEDALWLEQAWALGLHETDSVVHQRLVLNMRFLDLDADLSERELVRRAFEMGMHKSDTVVRRRLIDRVQAMIRAGVRSRVPEDSVLRRHYEESAEKWRRPALLELTHVYFSRDQRGDAALADAAALLPSLIAESTDPQAAISQGDAFLSGHQLRGATRNRIVATLGPDFADAVEGARLRAWLEPIQSTFGVHLVWLHDRVESEIPGFEEIRGRVLDDWHDDQWRAAMRDQLVLRKEVVEIRVIKDESQAASASESEGLD